MLMVFKLKTSKETQKTFAKIGAVNGLQPFALAKIAIALSIRKGPLNDNDFSTDNDGQELNRQTIFGEHDLLFKCLITCSENRAISENEYFPKIVKAHLDRGARILGGEARYSKNLYLNLCQLDSNI